MAKHTCLFWIVFVSYFAVGQVGIGTLNPNNSAQMDVVSSTKGILIPRVALNAIDDLSTISNGNVESLLVYNINASTDLVKGFYYWSGTQWEQIMIESSVKGLIDALPVVEVRDLLTSESAVDALSANQGRILKSLVDVNTAKETNVSTDISITEGTAARTIESSDGTDAVIPVASENESGLMSTALFNAVAVNSNKQVTIVEDHLTSTSTTNALSANQGRNLNDLIYEETARAIAAEEANTLAIEKRVRHEEIIDHLNSNRVEVPLSANQGNVLEGLLTDETNRAQQAELINAANIAVNVTMISLKENAANKSIDKNLSDTTDTKFPTELAVKTYVDTQLSSSIAVANALGEGKVFLGNTDHQKTQVALSGDVKIISDGTVTIQNEAVTTAKIANDNVTTDKLKMPEEAEADRKNKVLKVNEQGTALEWGKIDNTNIEGEELKADDTSIEVSNGAGAILTTSGIKVKDGGITEVKLANDAVTKEKIHANVAGTGLTQNNDGSLAVDLTGSPMIAGAGDITATDITVTGGEDAVLKSVQLSIADNAIITNKILNKNITPEKIANGAANQVLKTNADGDAVEWGTIDTNSITGADLTAPDGSIEVSTGGTGATLVASSIKVAKGGITPSKLAPEVAGVGLIQNEETNKLELSVGPDGDVTMNDQGVLVIGVDKVTTAKIKEGTANHILRTNADATGVEWGAITTVSITNSIVTKTDNYTTLITDDTVLVNPLAGLEKTITLSTAGILAGKKIIVKKTNDTTGTLRVESESGKIEGTTSIQTNVPYQGWILQFDGANWHIVGHI